MAAAPAGNGRGGVSLCLASAGSVKALALAAFTLVWTHSIEKIDWQEDWRVTPEGLELVQARVKGSGAGMEPPPEARLTDGWFQWRPARPPMREVMLGEFRRRRGVAVVQRRKMPDVVGDHRPRRRY